VPEAPLEAARARPEAVPPCGCASHCSSARRCPLLPPIAPYCPLLPPIAPYGPLLPLIAPDAPQSLSLASLRGILASLRPCVLASLRGILASLHLCFRGRPGVRLGWGVYPLVRRPCVGLASPCVVGL
jgi:hypothetical protein